MKGVELQQRHGSLLVILCTWILELAKKLTNLAVRNFNIKRYFNNIHTDAQSTARLFNLKLVKIKREGLRKKKTDFSFLSVWRIVMVSNRPESLLRIIKIIFLLGK